MKTEYLQLKLLKMPIKRRFIRFEISICTKAYEYIKIT